MTVIDAHVHLMPDRVRDNVEDVRRRDPWFAACHPEGKTMASIETLLKAMDDDGVDQTVCFTWPFASPELCREANDYIAKAQRQHTSRIIGFGIVNPASPDARAETERCASLGLTGIGELNADAQGWAFDDHAVDAFADLASRLGLIVNLHASESFGHDFAGRGTAWPSKIAQWAKRHGGLRTIASHVGGGLPFYGGIAAPSDLLWFDTAATPFLYAPTVYRQVLDACGSRRLLYGSDFPLLRLGRYRKEFEAGGLTSEELTSVLGGNAAELFGGL